MPRRLRLPPCTRSNQRFHRQPRRPANRRPFHLPSRRRRRAPDKPDKLGKLDKLDKPDKKLRPLSSG